MADRYVGLDLGISTIKAVEISAKNGVLSLTNAYLLPTPSDVMVDGTIIDYAEISDQVKKVIEAGGFGKKNIALSIKGSSIIARFARIPYLSIKQLENDMIFIADQYMKVDPEEYAIDYNIIHADNTTKTAQVLFGSTRRDILSDYVSVLESSELVTEVIDVESFALCNLYQILKYPEDGVSMILHVGHAATQAIILNSGHFAYHETLPAGGHYCNSLLANLADIPEDSVEPLKISPDSSGSGAQIKKVITSNFIPDLIRDMEKAISNYQVVGGQPPVRIFLSGGGATLYHLETMLKDKFQIAVSIMDPKEVIKVESSIALQVLENKPAILNVAISMALR